MLSIRRLTDPAGALCESISDQALISEQAVVQVGRTGLQIRFDALPESYWARFPAMPGTDAASVLLEPRGAGSSGLVLAALLDGAFTGCLTGIPRPSGWLEILDLRVDLPARRQGIGSQLTCSAAEYAARQGLYGLSVTSSDRNPGFCRFLLGEGFKLSGMDTMALAALPGERGLPLRQRACALYFYKTIRQGNPQ